MAVHHFVPTVYYNSIGSHPVALRIGAGDTVITTTIDASGRDKHGQQAGPRPNPQTGPFYVEGAEPGDTLVVHLDRLWPNRSTGWTRAIVAPNVVDPDYVGQLPENSVLDWAVDLEGGMLRLARPSARLASLSLPIRPMVGCFGVAPPDGQAISTSTSSTHGGNMDYRGFAEGVTVYFPVFVPGALFHIGDGHAIQGDGEIVGTGVEISFDVQFTVNVQKGRTIHWPRAENETHIIAAGNARPLDQALQHATTEMMRWLQSDYGFDAQDASTLLGQCVEYEVGNVYDPAYTVICKVAKSLLG